MPIVAHNDMPSFERLRREGQTVLAPDRALAQDIRELHIGLLNMMPDAALAATERQFMRLLGTSNPIAQFYIHPFTFPEQPRGNEALAHIERYYEPFGQIREQGLDALIITGANPACPELADEPFWRPLIEVIDWAYENVTSTLCSCLATHAILQFRYGQRRQPLGFKRWGVYPHRVMDRGHPLVRHINTRFDVPHSRFNEIYRHQFEAAGLRVLAHSDQAGVHLATSGDGFRFVYLQGHPEYDTISLLKEYQREIKRLVGGERNDPPPFPEHYFDRQQQALLNEFVEKLVHALAARRPLPELPESLLLPQLDNTWRDSGKTMVGSWIGKVYQVTHRDRRLPFMDGVDPTDPLGLRAARPDRDSV